MQQWFEFGAVNCQKKHGIFIRISITYYIKLSIDIYQETVFFNI